MKHKTVTTGLILILVLCCAGTAGAQYRGGRYHTERDSLAYMPGVIQITPFAGFLLGDEYDAEIDNGYYYGNIEQDDSAIFGVRIGFGVARNIGIEFQFSQASPEFYGVSGNGFFADRSKLSDSDIYHILGNVNFDFTQGPIVPYMAVGLGTTVYDMDNGDSNSEFTGTMAGGLKARIGPNIALRFEVRGYMTQITDSEYEYYYDGYYYDWYNVNDGYLTTLETSLGISFIL
ncbi:MAG TPA: outer membrane beta-barrel protein [bacterium]|nr:outer membrane beta-barrel protein [bacterium]